MSLRRSHPLCERGLLWRMAVDPLPTTPFEGREYSLLLQELRETRQRARLGGVFYPLAVALAFMVTTDEYLLQAAVITIFFAGLAVLRLAIRIPDAPDFSVIGMYRRRVWTLTLLSTFTWGAFSAWSFVTLPAPAPLVSVLFSGAFGMALAHSMAMRRVPCAIGIFAVMLPSLAMLWRGITPGVGVMWAVYLAYMLMVLMRSYREYRMRLELEVDLRQQRDLFEIQSRTDGLTGLLNRRSFANALNSSLEIARNGSAVSLLILDVDHFKSINDTHGHLAGDGCLVELARRLNEHFSEPGDVTGRLGGEEFGVVTQCDVETARQRAEKFRLDLQSTPLAYEGGDAPATVSIGCGAFDANRHAIADALYREVDAALYQAKMSGRNRTECAADLRAIPAGIAPAG